MFEIKIKDIAREEVEKSVEIRWNLTWLNIQLDFGDHENASTNLDEIESMIRTETTSVFDTEREMYIRIIRGLMEELNKQK